MLFSDAISAFLSVTYSLFWFVIDALIIFESFVLFPLLSALLLFAIEFNEGVGDSEEFVFAVQFVVDTVPLRKASLAALVC